MYAVIQAGLYYRMESVPAAVDLCYKAAFVFNLKYPQPSHSSWMFLQKAVFEMATKHDICSNKVMELLTSLE